MATSLLSCYTSPVNTGIFSKHQTVLPSFTSFFSSFTVPSPLSLRSTSWLAVVAAAANVVEVETPAVTKTNSKVLPFRVGHGFDLHRLEPGYSLISGGINIPHERGCEAHSDGNLSY